MVSGHLPRNIFEPRPSLTLHLTQSLRFSHLLTGRILPMSFSIDILSPLNNTIAARQRPDST